MSIQDMMKEIKKYEWFELCIHTNTVEIECCGDLKDVHFEDLQGGLFFGSNGTKVSFYNRDIKCIQLADNTFIVRFKDNKTVAYCLVG